MHQAPNPETFHFLQAIAERTDQMVFAYRLDTHQLIYLNPSFEQLWQQSRENIMADPAALLETIHPEDRDFVKKAYQQIIQGSKQKDLEFRLQLPDQSIHWLSVTPFLLDKEESGVPPSGVPPSGVPPSGVPPNGQLLLAGYAQDITAYKTHQETLNKYSHKKNAILQILSHDLGRPLANINGLSAMLAKRLKPSGEEKILKLVEMITQSSEQGIDLIRDFIDEEFLASANVELIKERVDIVEKLRTVIEGNTLK